MIGITILVSEITRLPSNSVPTLFEILHLLQKGLSKQVLVFIVCNQYWNIESHFDCSKNKTKIYHFSTYFWTKFRKLRPLCKPEQAQISTYLDQSDRDFSVRSKVYRCQHCQPKCAVVLFMTKISLSNFGLKTRKEQTFLNKPQSRLAGRNDKKQFLTSYWFGEQGTSEGPEGFQTESK